MSKALKEQVDKLFEATKDLQSLEEIKPHCELFNEWLNTSTNYSVESLGTVLSRVGFYKKFKSLKLEQGKNAESVPKHDKADNVVGNELKHYCLLLCGLDKKDWETRNETTRVSDRVTAINEDGSIGIEIKPDEYIEITAQLLESDNPHEIAVGLIASTGRRPHEILARGKFTPVEGESYQVMFEGQGKKRGEKPVFKISTLFPASYIIEKHNHLRRDASIKDLLKQVSNEFPRDVAAQNRAIEDRRGNSLRRVVQEYFGGKDSKEPLLNFRHGQEQNDCKALRAACAALVTERDCKGSMGAKMYFAASFLGHITPGEKLSDSDLKHITTTLGYSDYYLTVPVGFPDAPEKLKPTNVKALPEDLEVIKNLQTELNLNSQYETVHLLLEKFNTVTRLTQELAKANKKIDELEAKNKELQQESEEMQVKPAETITIDKNELEALIDARLEAKLNQLSISSDEIKPVNKTEIKTTNKPQPKQDDTDWESVSSEELRKLKSVGAIDEKLMRCFAAIKTHNSTVATSNDDRWYIGNVTLRELSGCNGKVVENWLKIHGGEVTDHNEAYGLGQYHNKRHKGKSITDVVNW
jgi:Telomere resolvase